MNTPQEIDSIVAPGEGPTLELQRSFDLGSVARHVAAMLNSGGGTIVLGVAPDGKMIGLPTPQATERALKKRLAKMLSPAAPFSTRRLSAGAKEIIVINVPAGPEGPYVHAQHIYLRRGAATVEADAATISRFIRDQGDLRARWERQPALGAEITDLDLAEIRRTASLASERRLLQLGEKPGEILDRLHLTIGGRPTNGAVVLFAKEPARWLPQTRVRAARFNGTDDASFEDNQVLEGHVFKLLAQLEEFLRRHVPIAAKLPRSGFQREERPRLPLSVLREALLNALAHRDYAAYSGGVRVGVWDDRIEIWNSGGLPDKVLPSDLKTAHASRPRNPDIANVLFLRGLVEGWGLGTTLIFREAVAADLPEPEWSELGGGTRLLLKLRRGAASSQLLPREREFLGTLETEQAFSSHTYERATSKDISARQARADLRKMVHAGYLRREGQGRSTRYLRTDKTASH